MYLRSLVTAVSLERDIVEVIHGQKHSYYLDLLGIHVEKNAPQPLALDDGEIDFPAPKRKRDILALEDGDIEEPDGADDNVDPALLDFDFEEALAAELELQDVIGAQDLLDEHIEDHGGGDGDAGADDDEERERAVANPSEYNHKWGPFTFTLKRSKTSSALSWQCMCPFHRKSPNSGCKKTLSVNTGTGLSFTAESDRVLDCLRHWANQALLFDRQRTHLGFHVLAGDEPPKEVISAQMITQPKPKLQDIQTDRQLDGFGDYDGSASSA